MIKEIFSTFFRSAFLSILLLQPGCGGGSSGTSLGGGSGERGLQFSGVVVNSNGSEVPFASVTLLNTDDTVVADEAGAFELNSDFPGGDAALSISPPGEIGAVLSLPDLPAEEKKVDLSIAYNTINDSVSRLNYTLRAKIVRGCSPQFLNTRTIKQTGPIAEGTVCTIETEIKTDGLPADNLVFELQHRGCSINDAWQFSGTNVTGTSGPGFGELNFKFKNDERHCVYRIIGPLNLEGVTTISSQLHTLRKIEFDNNQ